MAMIIIQILRKLMKDSLMVIIHILAHVHFILTLTLVLFITIPLTFTLVLVRFTHTQCIGDKKEELSALLFCFLIFRHLFFNNGHKRFILLNFKNSNSFFEVGYSFFKLTKLTECFSNLIVQFS